MCFEYAIRIPALRAASIAVLHAGHTLSEPATCFTIPRCMSYTSSAVLEHPYNSVAWNFAHGWLPNPYFLIFRVIRSHGFATSTDESNKNSSGSGASSAIKCHSKQPRLRQREISMYRFAFSTLSSSKTITTPPTSARA